MKSFQKRDRYVDTYHVLNKDVFNQLSKITNKPIVVIGGIGKNNYKKLLLNKADFLAISNFIWKNKKLKPAEATKSII